MNQNTLKKALLIKEIVDKYYYPCHRDCRRAIYMNYIVKIYPMSLSAFYRLLGIANKYVKEQENKKK
jgi:hypothetical protein